MRALVLLPLLVGCVEWNPGRLPVDTLRRSEMPVTLGEHWKVDEPEIARLMAGASMPSRAHLECEHRFVVLTRAGSCTDEDRALRTALLGRIPNATLTEGVFDEGQDWIRAETPELGEGAILRRAPGEACPRELTYYRRRCTKLTWAAAQWRDVVQRLMP